MKIYKYLFLLFTLPLLFSCQMSKTFHRSEQIPVQINKLAYFHFLKDTTYFKYNESTAEIKLLDTNQKCLHDSYQIKNEYFLSKDGRKLNAWLLKPYDKEYVGTILYFHGSAANLLFHYSGVAPLLAAGFQVFMVDYSGYGFSEGKSTRKNVLADAYAALDYVKNKTKTENGKLILYGQSYGGYLAAIIGANRQKSIDGIVIEGAFSSHRKEATHRVPFWGNFVKKGIIAAKEIQKNHKPILIIHSKEDRVVPIEFGRTIFENANPPKAFYEIDQEHVQGLKYYAKEITNKIKEMING